MHLIISNLFYGTRSYLSTVQTVQTVLNLWSLKWLLDYKTTIPTAKFTPENYSLPKKHHRTKATTS